MRASEKTYYNIKRLHVLFAVSSLALLGVTVWMLIADHRREWKRYQRTFRDRIEPWMTETQIRQERSRKSPDQEELDRLQRTLERQRPSFGKRLLRLPLIEALGRPLAIEQIWLPDLTIDYNFRRVARFDRCVTCHQGIDKTQPRRAFEPAFGREETLTVELATPEKAPKPKEDLKSVYGLALAEEGILDPRAATVQLVVPRTPAAHARLRPGDVIVKVDGRPIDERAAVGKYLLKDVEWGKPLALEISRGLPHPYCSHPRLELFVGSRSHHPMADFGCTICHDGQGSATEFKWASHTPNDPPQRNRWREQYGWFRNPHWDSPMLPARFAESRCLKCHHAVTDLEPSRRFPDPPAAKLLAGYNLVRQNGCFGCHEIKGFDESDRSIGPDMRLEPNRPQATTDPHPGTMRKVGPSLRDTRERLKEALLLDRIADPTNFLPSTRMPQFYGIHVDEASMGDAERFEAVEIQATVAYLLAASQPVQPLAAPAEVTEKPSEERGQGLFQTHGCLACHKHAGFGEGRATQGPDLTNVGLKFTTVAGADWLASWLRDPVRHSPRTLMPNPLLEPIPLAAEGEDSAPGKPKMTDPAADIAAYLMKTADWRPQPLPEFDPADLDEFALLYLKKTSSGGRDEAAVQLSKMTRPEKLQYVGRHTILKRGCYGCHDVPGFEDAQPIGPALTDWGRKQESLLAFEQINRFIQDSEARLAAAGTAAPNAGPDRGFYTRALLAQRREGFVWQKLREPRSFDYTKAQDKPYDEWLTMGKFNFTGEQIEAISTFVLGLVADPPAEKYVYQPDVRQKAIVEGRKVLAKYACAECHTLELERWEIEFDPKDFESDNRPPAFDDFAFLKPDIAPKRLDASRQSDQRGLRDAEITGVPAMDPETGRLYEDDYDEDDNPLYLFNLWEPAAINGQLWPVGGQAVAVWKPQIARRRPPQGGTFARLLHPVVFEQAGNPAMEAQAWGWVPPPLVHEGAKVQPAWLHDYLLAPYPVRPACRSTMPRYNMSPAEAGKLVDYFAAVSGVDFPYSSHPRRRPDRMDAGARQRLGKAMEMLIDTKTYCAKCHYIGDYNPGEEVWATLAPGLDQVGRRLRPEYVRRWLANPRTVLPYTGMPVNFPPSGEPVDPDRFPGSSVEQLDAMIDLLLNYDWYIKNRTSIRGMIKEAIEAESAAPNKKG